jgi:hypothetical protein
LILLIILHLIPGSDDPYRIVTTLVRALAPGSDLVLAHPASDICPAQMAEMTRRVNDRMSGPKATRRDRAAITCFFDGLNLLEPGVVQPQQWRPEPAALSPPLVTAWCGSPRSWNSRRRQKARDRFSCRFGIRPSRCGAGSDQPRAGEHRAGARP